jgi:hypothetical protein
VGVACASVKARIDPSRGTRVEIVLEAGADRIRAQSFGGPDKVLTISPNQFANQIPK